MSATLNAAHMAQYFDDARIAYVKVSGLVSFRCRCMMMAWLQACILSVTQAAGNCTAVSAQGGPSLFDQARFEYLAEFLDLRTDDRCAITLIRVVGEVMLVVRLRGRVIGHGFDLSHDPPP